MENSEILGPMFIFPDWVANKTIEFLMTPEELQKARRNRKPLIYVKEPYSKCLPNMCR